MKVAYNKRSDVLYITLSTPPHPCSYVELPGGVITRIDTETEQLVGVTIYNFMKQVEAGESVAVPGVGEDLSGVSLLRLYSQAS